jgi:hypothetical protein
MNSKLLTVYKSPFSKLRIGKNNDGGYIICDIPNVEYDIMLAGGVSDDISFEEHFLNRYPNVICYAFDGTIHCKIDKSNNNNIFFIKKNIGTINDEITTNLNEFISKGNNIFLKMDIEGDELHWIRILNDEQLKKFSQIVIEFHFPFSEKDNEVFEKLNKNHLLVHFHGNNCPAGVVNHNGIIIPNVFEVTYINKKYIGSTNLELNDEIIPGHLDMPNCPGNDIYIDYPPFVNKK